MNDNKRNYPPDNRNYGNKPGLGGFQRKPIIDQIPTAEFDAKWISVGIEQTCIDASEKLGRLLKENSFTTSQFRNIYGEIKRIQDRGFNENQQDFFLLRPKIAYNYGRDIRNQGFKIFYDFFLKAFHEVKPNEAGSGKRFNNFVALMEAILAYHKAAGGK